MDVGLVPIRKKGKLPYKVYEQTYALEYGTATLSIHEDAFAKGDRVAMIDDLLATGGTAAAAAALIEKAGGKVVELDFLIELAFLKGRAKLSAYPVFAPIVF
jgi:adenine phosphoribosyltransferase